MSSSNAFIQSNIQTNLDDMLSKAVLDGNKDLTLSLIEQGARVQTLTLNLEDIELLYKLNVKIDSKYQYLVQEFEQKQEIVHSELENIMGKDEGETLANILSY